MSMAEHVKTEDDKDLIAYGQYGEASSSRSILDTSHAAAMNGEKPLFSQDSPPPDDIPLSSLYRSPSPPSSIKGEKGIKKEESPKPQLVDHLPSAWDEAHETFDVLEKCVYERKDLGLSREQDEMMVCDCVYDKHNADAAPCGPDSDCINRAIFIECLAEECRAKKQCQNQRFMKRQFGPVDIVSTELKGYGLRASNDMPAGTLIYEYIGEVVQEKTFRKRMQQYAEEGIRHFYFMMLQKEEYIDATKKGGIGRFANHSCNPNSEVQKWVVGRRLRMGIFTKRDVMKGEEITFNYNVDRYGHEAQTCYCGEPNCVGTIGGKTQTDVGTINDLFLDALGITDEVEALGLKGNKKKKSRQLDDDWIPTLRPIETEQEVQKVAAAIRQSAENPTMMDRLLQRVNMTEDPMLHRQLLRMHGFGLMYSVLTQFDKERHIVLLALESMRKWKLQTRNKIEDSHIQEPVTSLSTGDDAELSIIARELLEYWSTLELSNRIPRKSKITSLDAEDEAATTTIAEADLQPSAHRRPQAWENTNSVQLEVAPVRARPPPFARPRLPPTPTQPPPSVSHSNSADRSKLDAIIAMAQQSVAAAAAAAPLATESPAAGSSRSGSRALDDEKDAERMDLDRRKRQRRENGSDDDAKKEKRLTKLVGDFVVRSMSKYKDQMEHETFKRYAKECTMILVEKEKKGHSYAASRNPSLSEEKKAKMKSFVKEYTHKVLKKLKEKGKLRRVQSKSSIRPSVTSTDSPVTPLPNATPITESTPSAAIGTPNGSHVDLVADIFGGSDDEAVNGDPIDDDGDEKMDYPRAHELSPTTPIDHRFMASSPIKDKANGAIRVDSFRPGQIGIKDIPSVSLDTPSQTPRSTDEL